MTTTDDDAEPLELPADWLPAAHALSSELADVAGDEAAVLAVLAQLGQDHDHDTASALAVAALAYTFAHCITTTTTQED